MDIDRIKKLQEERQAAVDRLGPLTIGINGKKQFVHTNGQPDPVATDAKIKRLTDLMSEIDRKIEAERQKL